jgi:hypothetical protein
MVVARNPSPRPTCSPTVPSMTLKAITTSEAMKLKRKPIAEKYANEIESLYGGR